MLFSALYKEAAMSNGDKAWFKSQLGSLGYRFDDYLVQRPFGWDSDLTVFSPDKKVVFEILDKESPYGRYFVRYIDPRDDIVLGAEMFSSLGETVGFLERIVNKVKFDPDIDVERVTDSLEHSSVRLGLKNGTWIFTLKEERNKSTNYRYKYEFGQTFTSNFEVSITYHISSQFWSYIVRKSNLESEVGEGGTLLMTTDRVVKAILLKLGLYTSKPTEKHEPLTDKNQQAMLALVNKVKQKGQVSKQEMERFFKEYAVQ